jgi:diguanylate cyclase (GGDEF)-like protein
MHKDLERVGNFRMNFIYYFSFVGILSTTLFGVIPNMLIGNRVLSLYELILVVLASLNLLYFHKKKNYETASTVILLLMVLVLEGLIVSGGYKGTGILWIYTFPLLAFFLKPYGQALLWNILFALSTLLLLVLNEMGIIKIYYSKEVLRQAAGAFIAVALLSFFYSMVINKLILALRDRATKDPLTGLYNRDFVFETLERLVDRVKRGNEPTHCLAYIDLDNFKSVNDRFGHHEGDRVLKEFARMIRSSFRRGDVIGRVGGDEFVAIVYGCSPKMVEKRLKNLKDRIEKSGNFKGISFSYGLVRIDDSARDADEVIKNADEKMYIMKKGHDQK